MLVWCMVLFLLGIMALLDSLFNYGYIFRTANSFAFMLVALGILVRTRRLQKWGAREQLVMNNEELKERLMALKNTVEAEEREEPVEELPVDLSRQR